ISPSEHDWLQILRLEEVYPFPHKILKEKLAQYPNVKEIVWVQEEPKNMGAWTFVEPLIHAVVNNKIEVSYIGRKRRSSPAEGEPDIHKIEQARIVGETLTRK